uniref:Uncharacterized protein n=1 Tax=Arundo donax TaxID=35708 RepID=A0A0A9AW42_ARUDO
MKRSPAAGPDTPTIA